LQPPDTPIGNQPSLSPQRKTAVLPRLATHAQIVNHEPNGNLIHLHQVAQAAADQHGISPGLVGAIVVVLIVVAAISSSGNRDVHITVSRGEVGTSLITAVVVVGALLLMAYAVVNVWNK
jgi:hypothetical protein